MTFKLLPKLVCFYFACTSFAGSNCGSVTPGYRGRYGQEPAHYEVIVPQRVTSDGEFMSYMIPYHYKRSYYRNKRSADLTEHDVLHYVVPIAGEDLHLELSPNVEMVSPSMVVERFRERGSSGPRIRPSDDVQCHYRGAVRGDGSSKVALSTCYGLVGSANVHLAGCNIRVLPKTGYIRSKRGYFFIEPSADHYPLSGEEHPHLVYERESDVSDAGANCYVAGNVARAIAKRAANEYGEQKKGDNLTNAQLYIETLVVLDHSLLEYHKSIDIENYVLTVFNMAHDLYHDCTLGINVNLAIVRLIRLEYQEYEMNLALNKNANKTLEYFASWQKKVNPGDDNHPNHHDVAVLLTRTDICGDDQNCAILGAARVGSMCDAKDSAALCEDNGLRLGFVIAHEIAHTLAIPHDTEKESGCKDRIGDKNFTSVMSPSVGLRTTGWSQCSKKFFQLFMDSGLGHCLHDPPTEHSFEMADVLPGVMYGGDFQCRELFGPNAALCDTGMDCENLICFLEGKGCVETHMPPAEGTSCGEKKWCYRGQCIQTGERPSAVNGGWSAWSAWSTCSRTCGAGVMWQERYCNNPRPSKGGKYCQGQHRHYQMCNTEPCEMDQPSFRDVQCSEFDEWVYPEDGKLHSWRSYRMPEENPCVLYCVSDEGSVVSLKPRVAEGTPCNRGIRDVCINGMCQEVPCDLKLDSNAVEDACGVCHGDGTSCQLHEGERFIPGNATAEKVLLFELCKDSVNIKVEETTPSEARIQVTCGKGTTMYIDGSAVGMYNVPGSKAWLGMIRTNQEALEIPGPVGAKLEVWVVPTENVTVKYSYGTPVSEKRTGSYFWDYTKWSKCSAFCGPGTETALPRCVEKIAGVVDDDYCKQIPKPEPQVRPCEVAPCIPRWMVGDWQACSKCPKGKRERIVKCVRSTGEGEGEIDVIPDWECAKPKPRSKEKCSCETEKPTSATPFPHKLSKRLLSDTSPGPCSKQPERNKTVIDKENPSNIRLTMHVEIDDDGKYPKGVPRPKGNSSVVVLEGKQALAFLNQMQKDFSNNRTKI